MGCLRHPGPHAAQSWSVLPAKRQVLFDAIDVCRSKERRLSQRPAALGAFPLQQMASARASEQDFACAGYFETFGH